ncbi:ubiquitin carboxyl-terminal hydrolase 14-like isoform X1 [Rhododendron vialii]|uniref:ubiquitin carboxyl-terminal hydrolase 14-like isoform X1 n=1 Tax=Rhododendron vialii TaxID=182163 RepID=UPI00265FB601|nr:ubiquitin carboxyl-terminal hydrolase 14-like isoform X1 [Rhododendron vialii]
MELLRANLSRVRIPEPTNRIYKHECCISFDTPKSEGGLFIDMNTFLAFGKDCVGWNFEKTGNPVYLHIRQTRKLVCEDRPLKKPTLLAIGVDGGFDNNETEYEETKNIVILPDYVTLPFPSVELPEKVRLAVDAILMAEGAERKEQVASWTADKKHISEYTLILQQLGNGVIIPPSGWKCAKCDKTENLWLNLTDGMILCGRRNWDGSGGNNHAIEHFKETGYPVAVKLGTITADLDAADVFSYPEDESVLDPLLAQHLAFFGIDFSSLQKTEMTTAERELDQNTNFDWNRIQESGQEMEPLFGSGYTGLVNLGNSCYLAATMQVVFSTRSFCSRYYMTQSLKKAFEAAPADPTVDLNTQLAKLAHGLLSGKYSVPAPEKEDSTNVADATPIAKQEGIPPRMFKGVIAASHPEFSTMRQQDALEFFLHFIDQVERVSAGKPEFDPSTSFKFGIEERLLCPSGKVAYNRRHDYILSLSIPLHLAINKDELEAFHKSKAERDTQGKEVRSTDEIVRPRVRLVDCLRSFVAEEEVHDFYSNELKAKVTATKTAGLVSFPDYLVLHMRKFVMEAGWVPKKLDVYIDVPDTIDISDMRSKGIQPGEELLPEPAAEDIAEPKLLANDDIVSQLVSMGFNNLHCEKAAINTSNAGVEEAMNWLLSHMDDADIDAPIPQEAQSVDQSKVDTLVSFGFQEDVARKALKASGGDIEKATDWIFNPTNVSSSSNMDVSSSSTSIADSPLPDGGGAYRLMGIVSHIGTSTQCGHYVAHINKDGQWVIFNDEKVGVSKNPPKDMGYLYVFERLNS